MAKTEEAKQAPLVRLYNKTARKFSDKHEGVDYHAHPSTFCEVPEVIATKWLRMFPEELVQASVAQKEIAGSAAEAAELRERVAELEAEVKKSATKKVAELTDEVDKLETKVLELEEANSKLVDENTKLKEASNGV